VDRSHQYTLHGSPEDSRQLLSVARAGRLRIPGHADRPFRAMPICEHFMPAEAAEKEGPAARQEMR
jgi:hypothetical protein